MKNGEIYQIKTHRIPFKDCKANIHVDSGDHTILKVYKNELNVPMRAVNHFFIGLGARCYEEKHDEEIRDLQEIVRIQAVIIVKYIEKYGQLPIKNRYARVKNLARRVPTGEIVSVLLKDKREHHFREYKSSEGLARPYRTKRDLILGDRWVDLAEPED